MPRRNTVHPTMLRSLNVALDRFKSSLRTICCTVDRCLDLAAFVPPLAICCAQRRFAVHGTLLQCCLYMCLSTKNRFPVGVALLLASLNHQRNVELVLHSQPVGDPISTRTSQFPLLPCPKPATNTAQHAGKRVVGILLKLFVVICARW